MKVLIRNRSDILKQIILVKLPCRYGEYKQLLDILGTTEVAVLPKQNKN